MTQISEHAAAARETHRENDGRFGVQPRTGPPGTHDQAAMAELSARELCQELQDMVELHEDPIVGEKARVMYDAKADALAHSLVLMTHGPTAPDVRGMAQSYRDQLAGRFDSSPDLAKEDIASGVSYRSENALSRRVAAEEILAEMCAANAHRADPAGLGKVDGYAEAFAVAWRPSDTTSVRQSLSAELDEMLRAGETDPDKIRAWLGAVSFVFEN